MLRFTSLTIVLLRVGLGCAVLTSTMASVLSQSDKASEVSREEIKQAAETLRRDLRAKPLPRLDLQLKARQQAVLAQQFDRARLQMRQTQLQLCILQGVDKLQFSFALVRRAAIGDELVNDELLNELLRIELAGAQQALSAIEPICMLTDEQKEKLQLAAETNARRMHRAAMRWMDEFGEAFSNLEQLAQARAEIEKLNELMGKLSGEENLFNKVFATVLTNEQASALRQSHLSWFFDYAFAIGVPVEQRRDFEKMLQSRAAKIPLHINDDVYCRQVIDSISLEELKATVDAGSALRIKRSKEASLTDRIVPLDDLRPAPRPVQIR